MAIETWIDDYDNTFSKPYIPQKILGFSGIDPDLVAGTGSSSASGDIDIISFNHEMLDGLLGGDENGHYHLNSMQYRELLNGVVQDHEELDNLKGGNPNDHYHLDHLTYDYLFNMIYELYRKPGATQASNSFIGQVLREPTFNTLIDARINARINEIIDARISEYLSNNP